MNQRITKRLRRTIKEKTPDVLMLVQTYYGDKTKNITSEKRVWRMFKQLYYEGKIPMSLIVKRKEKEV